MEDQTLTDRWMRMARNNPLFAIMTVLVAVVGVVTPLYSSFQQFFVPDKGDQIDVDRARLLSDRDKILVPIRHYLDENKAVYDLLSSDLYAEPDLGIQESYYTRVSRDGAGSHELMKGQIDALVENNKKISSLLIDYPGRARSKKFFDEVKKFRVHARLYEVRWRGMKKAAISGERIPTAEPVFPKDFPSALDMEIQKVNQMLGKP